MSDYTTGPAIVCPTPCLYKCHAVDNGKRRDTIGEATHQLSRYQWPSDEVKSQTNRVNRTYVRVASIKDVQRYTATSESQ